MILINIFTLFSRTYIKYAIIVGVIMALCLALLGVSLVLKKHSMIGDGLSHVGFGAVAIALAIGWAPLYFAIPIVILASFVILYLAEKNKAFGDSAIALFSTVALAVGYVATEFGDGIKTSVNQYFYGSILTVSLEEVIISVIVGIIVIVLFIILYNRIFSVTFDQTFSKASGINTTLINVLISVLSSIIVVIGMKVMGALLITSLIIFPVLSSRQLFKKFKQVTIFAAIFSIISFFIGFIFACIIDKMPIGSSIVFANLFTLIISIIIGKILTIYKKNKMKLNEDSQSA